MFLKVIKGCDCVVKGAKTYFTICNYTVSSTIKSSTWLSRTGIYEDLTHDLAVVGLIPF